MSESKSSADESLPKWASLLKENDGAWHWEDGRFLHKEAGRDAETESSSYLKGFMVKHIYADQHKSFAVKEAMRRRVEALPEEGWALNLGSGSVHFDKRFINLDLKRAPSIHITTVGTDIPFRNDALDLVVAQEVLEHIGDFHASIAEVHRVLKPGGYFYVQCPFQISYHPGPKDFWRFTRDSYEYLFENECWELIELKPSLGHGTGFYRICVEFWAVNASILSQSLYKPIKALAAVLFYPLKWLDPLGRSSKEVDRIPGGYYAVARKR